MDNNNTLIIKNNNCEYVITFKDSNNTELAANIIHRNMNTDTDKAIWKDIGNQAFNLRNTSSIVHVNSEIFDMFPLKYWKEYYKQ